MFVCHSVHEGWKGGVRMSPLPVRGCVAVGQSQVTWDPLPQTPPGSVQACSNICWQAGSWHSTEMHSCLIQEFQCLKHKWKEINICDF